MLLRGDMGGHIEIPPAVVTKDVPATWVTSLVEWVGVHRMELHMSGQEYSGMLMHQGPPPLESTDQYRSTGIATVSKLPTSTEEVLLRATQCSFVPELAPRRVETGWSSRSWASLLRARSRRSHQSANLGIIWCSAPRFVTCWEIYALRSTQGEGNEGDELELVHWWHL